MRTLQISADLIEAGTLREVMPGGGERSVAELAPHQVANAITPSGRAGRPKPKDGQQGGLFHGQGRHEAFEPGMAGSFQVDALNPLRILASARHEGKCKSARTHA